MFDRGIKTKSNLGMWYILEMFFKGYNISFEIFRIGIHMRDLCSQNSETHNLAILGFPFAWVLGIYAILM
jgi:hypothetical protein